MATKRFCDVCEQPLRDEDNVVNVPVKGDYNMARGNAHNRRVAFTITVTDANSGPAIKDLCRTCLFDTLDRADHRPRETVA